MKKEKKKVSERKKEWMTTEHKGESKWEREIEIVIMKGRQK